VAINDTYGKKSSEKIENKTNIFSSSECYIPFIIGIVGNKYDDSKFSALEKVVTDQLEWRSPDWEDYKQCNHTPIVFLVHSDISENESLIRGIEKINDNLNNACFLYVLQKENKELASKNIDITNITIKKDLWKYKDVYVARMSSTLVYTGSKNDDEYRAVEYKIKGSFVDSGKIPELSERNLVSIDEPGLVAIINDPDNDPECFKGYEVKEQESKRYKEYGYFRRFAEDATMEDEQENAFTSFNIAVKNFNSKLNKLQKNKDFNAGIKSGEYYFYDELEEEKTQNNAVETEKKEGISFGRAKQSLNHVREQFFIFNFLAEQYQGAYFKTLTYRMAFITAIFILFQLFTNADGAGLSWDAQFIFISLLLLLLVLGVFFTWRNKRPNKDRNTFVNYRLSAEYLRGFMPIALIGKSCASHEINNNTIEDQMYFYEHVINWIKLHNYSILLELESLEGEGDKEIFDSVMDEWVTGRSGQIKYLDRKIKSNKSDNNNLLISATVLAFFAVLFVIWMTYIEYITDPDNGFNIDLTTQLFASVVLASVFAAMALILQKVRSIRSLTTETQNIKYLLSIYHRAKFLIKNVDDKDRYGKERIMLDLTSNVISAETKWVSLKRSAPSVTELKNLQATWGWLKKILKDKDLYGLAVFGISLLILLYQYTQTPLWVAILIGLFTPIIFKLFQLHNKSGNKSWISKIISILKTKSDE
jgi:hypothetical protein